MIFHEQQACVYDFPSQFLATCASAGVSELVLSTRGFATLPFRKASSDISAEARVAQDSD